MGLFSELPLDQLHCFARRGLLLESWPAPPNHAAKPWGQRAQAGASPAKASNINGLYNVVRQEVLLNILAGTHASLSCLAPLFLLRSIRCKLVLLLFEQREQRHDVYRLGVQIGRVNRPGKPSKCFRLRVASGRLCFEAHTKRHTHAPCVIQATVPLLRTTCESSLLSSLSSWGSARLTGSWPSS